jgi:hypothetical protein
MMDLNELIDKSLYGLANDEALEHIGLLIDAAGDAGSASGTDRARSIADRGPGTISPSSRAMRCVRSVSAPSSGRSCGLNAYEPRASSPSRNSFRSTRRPPHKARRPTNLKSLPITDLPGIPPAVRDARLFGRNGARHEWHGH